MQTPISSRPGNLEVTQKVSPVTPRTRKLKSSPGSTASSPSPNGASKTPKDRSPKLVVDRKSPRVPVTEKKRPSKVSELEPQIAQLQEELKKAKEQLTSSEWWKKRAQQEAEEAKKQLVAMSAKLEESQRQLNKLYESDEARIQELRRISQDRDRAWQSELNSVQRQYSMDSATLASAMHEIQKLKAQLDRVSQSEASQARHAESAHAEIRGLRIELTETLDLVERLKERLNESREYEAHAAEEASKARTELEAARNEERALRLECDSVKESFSSLVVEMEKSKMKAKSLEEIIVSLRNDGDKSLENVDCDESKFLRGEVDRLRASLEEAERRYQEEYVQSTMQIRNAYQLMELAKSESSKREAELHEKLKESKGEVKELRAILEENRALEDLQSSLLEKEARLKSMRDENEKLRRELTKRKTEENRGSDGAAELTESCKKVERVTEQLDAAQASNIELEIELRKLKVQCDQWRKAAEAAAAMVVNVERTGSLDFRTNGKKLSSSPFSDDTDEDSPKKKNGNMLRKLGVLLKKGQK